MTSVSEFLSRHPWAWRFVTPVLAFLAARGVVLEVTDLDVILDYGVTILTAAAALWRYVRTERRTVPIDPKAPAIGDVVLDRATVEAIRSDPSARGVGYVIETTGRRAA